MFGPEESSIMRAWAIQDKFEIQCVGDPREIGLSEWSISFDACIVRMEVEGIVDDDPLLQFTGMDQEDATEDYENLPPASRSAFARRYCPVEESISSSDAERAEPVIGDGYSMEFNGTRASDHRQPRIKCVWEVLTMLDLHTMCGTMMHPYFTQRDSINYTGIPKLQ